MKIKNLVTIAALALAGGGLFQMSAKAANATASVGDLILCFRVNDGAGTGATEDYEIDLGYTSSSLVTAAQAAPGGVLSLSGAAGLAAADLTTIYGSGWNARTDLVWSVVGTTGTPTNTLWVTDPTSPISLVPNTENTSASQGGPAGKINLLYGSIAGTALQPVTLSSPNGAEILAGNAGSYTTEINYSKNYNYFNKSTEQGVVSSGAATANLIQLTVASIGTAGTNLGTFSLDSAGTFQFSTPIPEPSTYAMFGMGALGLVILARRRRLMLA